MLCHWIYYLTYRTWPSSLYQHLRYSLFSNTQSVWVRVEKPKIFHASDLSFVHSWQTSHPGSQPLASKLQPITNCGLATPVACDSLVPTHGRGYPCVYMYIYIYIYRHAWLGLVAPMCILNRMIWTCKDVWRVENCVPFDSIRHTPSGSVLIALMFDPDGDAPGSLGSAYEDTDM